MLPKRTITSVGIDIGTTTTHLIFSRLHLESVGPTTAVPRIHIAGKQILYRSPIYPTPMADHATIDARAIARMTEQEYQAAHVQAGEVDTGVVIVTGETARAANAAAVVQELGSIAGKFVAAAAGPHLEAVIAGKGSGAAQEAFRRGQTVANVDIGGGTINVAVFAPHTFRESAALLLGSRTVTFDSLTGAVTSVTPPGQWLVETEGLGVLLGKRPVWEAVTSLVRRMAGVLDELLGLSPPTPALHISLLTESLCQPEEIQAVMLSGGVAKLFYETSHKPRWEDLWRYGDLGPLLAEALRAAQFTRHLPILRSQEPIRATAIGAGMHTLHLSGSTTFVDSGLLPLRNIPVAFLPLPERALVDEIATQVQRACQRFPDRGPLGTLAFAAIGPSPLEFPAVREFASGVALGFQEDQKAGRPLILLLQQDVGKAVGFALRRLIPSGSPVIVLDQLVAQEGDYIDIHTPLYDGHTVPVTLKTLVFSN